MTGISISGFDGLLDSLDYRTSGTVQYTVRAGVDYAIYVEYGTSKMQAQPFLRPAVEEAVRDLDRIIGSDLDPDTIADTLANEIADNAQSRAPVDTGALRDSIEVEKQ
ncbi:HK97-gp10 family putative phage morphogenesis protein [Natrialba asiatica]|uniref:Uncharacterized protein n=1 Tax=Natrialba asiatica (strain ATCC 700177 / DSM 12278 / JCM 9576 / FERM P-10747 / NBRC 102637 / 172P1) TaxID=29540 RepID=M0AR14_NATA1|nr:HK97-gp10 family putative phage morphogenesis protein [Natrialba asiatica]ELZ00767.1 hypothetical protein C481_11050 [Natrialba asiatica DSM 12278]